MPIKPRRPYEDDKPDGYLESDMDFVANNFDLCVKLSGRLPEILDNDSMCSSERTGAVYEIVEE
jgi:hypothetical protein